MGKNDLRRKCEQRRGLLIALDAAARDWRFLRKSRECIHDGPNRQTSARLSDLHGTSRKVSRELRIDELPLHLVGVRAAVRAHGAGDQGGKPVPSLVALCHKFFDQASHFCERVFHTARVPSCELRNLDGVPDNVG